MPYPFYTGAPGAQAAARPADLPVSRRAEQTRPDRYLADAGLVDAVNVALLLGQPLLLTGEPGTGKTQLASSLAWELGLGDPLRFETKSTSTAGDLFYTYDSLARFHAAQTGVLGKGTEFITFNALGRAILRANALSAVAGLLPAGHVHDGPRRSVVLIDEVDKAPRDFANDLLNEVEGMFFRIPELGNVRVEADPSMQPIVVVTSNSEKSLPDAFLRRCIYYHIPFPDRDRLAEVIAARLGKFSGKGQAFLDDALDLFYRLRDAATGLRKRPATAEVLGWVAALRELYPGVDNPLAGRDDVARRSVSVLVKTVEDREVALAAWDRWRKERGR
ncbi:MAG: MoxR family ATPase [Isosphaeraceae bacterium]